MNRAACLHKLEQQLRLLFARGRPVRGTQRICKLLTGLVHLEPRMHQGVHRARHETVVDEEIFLDSEFRVAAFEIAGAIIFHTMAQRKILRSCRSANRIGLHEAESVESALQGGGREKVAADSKAAQVVERHRSG